MTPKEKAIEILSKYEYLVNSWNCLNNEPLEIKDKLPDMKECALIVVDEMIDNLEDYTGKYIKYWLEVRKEIKKL